jgi:hypothetical protein
MFSLAFITVSDKTLKNEKKHFLKWFGIIMGTGIATMISGAYLIAIPVASCMKKRKTLTHLMIGLTAIVYFICLSIMLWGLQHIVIHATAVQCYSMSGQIGLVFGLLVLYDSMKGENVAELYERVLTELDDELEMDDFGHDRTSNKVGIDDTDLQRS